MKNINKIIESFDGEEEVVIICSDNLIEKIKQELSEITNPESSSVPYKGKSNFSWSISKNGVTVHFASDLDSFLNKKDTI